MKAMILAAGFGTRLNRLTADTPKALVSIMGKPLLNLLLDKLIKSGFEEIAVNAHHESDQMSSFINNYKKEVSAKISFSYEPTILNTGGGIKRMLRFFSDKDPILVQNVDVLCDINYSNLFESHTRHSSNCTLVVNRRKTDRPLSFDSQMSFKGRGDSKSPDNQLFGFCGIQVINPNIFDEQINESFYSIEAYIDALKTGKRITGYNIHTAYWRDLGTIKDIENAEQDIIDGNMVVS
jgi:N-acetyl-alpha-D-muramate 1-phosphate uridylyltransferase